MGINRFGDACRDELDPNLPTGRVIARNPWA
jgi:hypothetical protein